MLSKEQNEMLTQVGPGTPMGELLRRYWYPIAFQRDLDEWPIKKVRLLGEDFALWKTPEGGYGIIQERCPHRHASLVNGVIEEDGIRCGYHGWKFDCAGACVDQPAEPDASKFKDRVTAFTGKAELMRGADVEGAFDVQGGVPAEHHTGRIEQVEIRGFDLGAEESQVN